MGGRGTFASGIHVVFIYETVGKIDGVKILEKIDKKASRSLPEEAHSSKAYLLLSTQGSFKRYREYDRSGLPKFDIDFHPEPRITGHHKAVLHLHFYSEKGVRDAVGRILTKNEYEQYKKFFVGLGDRVNGY